MILDEITQQLNNPGYALQLKELNCIERKILDSRYPKYIYIHCQLLQPFQSYDALEKLERHIKDKLSTFKDKISHDGGTNVVITTGIDHSLMARGRDHYSDSELIKKFQDEKCYLNIMNKNTHTNKEAALQMIKSLQHLHQISDQEICN